jgi:hypothetical protein
VIPPSLENSQHTQSPVPEISPLEKGPGYSIDTNVVLPILTKESATGVPPSPVVHTETTKPLIIMSSHDSQRAAASGGAVDLEPVPAQLPPTNPPSSIIAGEIASSSVTRPTVPQEARDKVAMGSTNIPFVARGSIDNDGLTTSSQDKNPVVGKKQNNKNQKAKKNTMQETREQ